MIDEKNGLNYIKVGDYWIPDLQSDMKPVEGKYAEMRFRFLKENKEVEFWSLLTTGQLNQHLQEVQDIASQRVNLLVEQMAENEQVNEELKAKDQMKWVGLMNNIKNSAEEIVLREVVYS